MAWREVHPDDQRELDRLRRELMGWRAFLRLRMSQAAEKIGVTMGVIWHLEHATSQPRLDSVQRWARAYGLELRPNLVGIAVKHDLELETLRLMAQDPDALSAQRLYLVSLLTAARQQQGISQAKLAEYLESSKSFVSWIERRATEPSVVMLMAYARGIGLVLRWDLIEGGTV